jgi:hypothetical protein
LHAAALVSFLKAAAHGQGDNPAVFPYVAATSNQKMLRRFEHDTKLKQVLERILSIPPSQAIQSARTFPDGNPVAAQRDAAFLEALSAPFNEKFFRLSTIGVENLMAIAMAYKPGAAIPQIYKKETCEDLHRLLCHLLRSYKTSIAKLSDFEASSSTGDDADEFKIAVYGVATCGMTLGALSYSSFIDEHMWRIIPSRHMEGSLRELDDVGFQANSESYSGRHAYADSLRSLAVYYEAAGDLLRMAPHIHRMQVSLEVVAVPKSGTSMRPWQQVVGKLVSSSNSMERLGYKPQDAILAIEKFVSRNADLSARLKGDMSLGRNFHGTIHSQACLASIIHHSDFGNLVSTICNLVCRSNSRNSQDPKRAFGVSEQCCQVCSHLISLLGIPEPCNPIHEEPSMHQQVVACTLPSWLPPSILDAMISHFGAELLLVIQNLCLKSRSKSTEGSMDPPAPTTSTYPNASMGWFSAILEKIRGLL